MQFALKISKDLLALVSHGMIRVKTGSTWSTLSSRDANKHVIVAGPYIMERMGNTSSPRRQEEQEIHPQEEERINDDEDSDSSSDNGQMTYHILVDPMRTVVHEDTMPLQIPYDDLNNEDSDSEGDSLVALQLLARLFGANLRRRYCNYITQYKGTYPYYDDVVGSSVHHHVCNHKMKVGVAYI